MRTLTLVCLGALLAIAGTAPAHAQSTATPTDNTSSVSGNSSSGDASTQQPHVKIMWARPLANPVPKTVRQAPSPSHPVPLAEVVREEEIDATPPHRKGDYKFQYGWFPYHSFYAWVPPIGNQPVPYGLWYW